MANRIELTAKYLSNLKAGDSQGILDMLADDAAFMQGSLTVPGRQAVVERMLSDAGRIYRDATWIDPQPDGEAVRATGKTPAGSNPGGVILTIHFKDDQIALIQHQNLPGPPRPATAIKLTPEIKKLVNGALEDGYPIVVAHIDEDGQPVLTFRGSTQAYSDDQLAMWVRNPEGRFLRSIAKNPKLAFMYRNGSTRAMFQFQGRARIDESEQARRQVYENSPKLERDLDFARIGAALIVDLDLVEGFLGAGPTGIIGAARMVRGAE